MADDTKKQPEAKPEVEQETLREAVAARFEQIRLERIETERKERKTARDKRAQERKEARLSEARRRRAAQVKAFNEARERMGGHVADASRALRAALRDATSVSFPRTTQEGREQQRLVRDLQAVLGRLSGVGRGTFYEADLDEGLDLDLETG